MIHQRMKRGLSRLLLSCTVMAPVLLQAQSASLTIEITNIRFEKGWIRLGLYNHPDQFPVNPSRSYDFRKTALKDGVMEILLNDILPGTYAISLLDDVNGNDRMDYKLIKIPREGFGFSNNVKPVLKHPHFHECSFLIREGTTRIRIEMQYFQKIT